MAAQRGAAGAAAAAGTGAQHAGDSLASPSSSPVPVAPAAHAPFTLGAVKIQTGMVRSAEVKGLAVERYSAVLGSVG